MDCGVMADKSCHKDSSSRSRKYLDPSNEALLFQDFVALCPDGVIGINREGIVTIFNQAAEVMTGWPAAEVVDNAHVDMIYNPPSLGRQIKRMLYSQKFGGRFKLVGVEVEIMTREGRPLPIRLSAALIIRNGKEVGSIGFFRDQTKRKRLEEELRKLSITDSLTGLYNRRHFHKLLIEETERTKRYGSPLTLVCLDLDNFKLFNDAFGHSKGDDILRLLGKCAREKQRSQDRAFRLGGDEFAFLLIETDLDGGVLVAERFRRYFNKRWDEAMGLETQHLKQVYVSLGLAQYYVCEEANSLLFRADVAMYQAKRSGGNRTVKSLTGGGDGGMTIAGP